MNRLIGRAMSLPVNEPSPVVSVAPVVLRTPDREVDLELRVSAPATGGDLPIILFSHGHGMSNYLSSLYGYGPLTDFYAASGFAVIQPTHLNSKAFGGDPSGREGALFWRSRPLDMRMILNRLDEIEAAVPQIAGRLDRSRVATVGHSLGGHTVSLLAGATIDDPASGETLSFTDERIRAHVLLGAPGVGADLAAPAKGRFPVLGTTRFDAMAAPALVVAGDKDRSPVFSEREDWRMDAYYLSPGPKCLLRVFGAEHLLGGVTGYDAAETTDEDPERVALVQRVTGAYLRSALGLDEGAWDAARTALESEAEPLARVECK